MKSNLTVFLVTTVLCCLAGLYIMAQRLDDERSIARRDISLLKKQLLLKELDAIKAGVAEYKLDANYERIFVWKTNRVEKGQP